MSTWKTLAMAVMVLAALAVAGDVADAQQTPNPWANQPLPTQQGTVPGQSTPGYYAPAPIGFVPVRGPWYPGKNLARAWLGAFGPGVPSRWRYIPVYAY